MGMVKGTTMQITMRPMTAEEAWQHILNNHYMYHSYLKNYAYDYDMFIPMADFIVEMFGKEKLTPDEIATNKDRFINHFYNVTKLQKMDRIFNESVKQRFELAVNEHLVPLLSSWNATMPKVMEIQCAYGYGSGYWRRDDDHALMLFRVTRYPNNADALFGIMFHEFVHMLIEKPIIQKYHVPQDLKERIVDLICWEFIKRKVQPPYEKSFANAYITADAIKTDLPGAVAKMMADYTKLQKQQQAGK